MRENLLELICCPTCKGELALEAEEAQGEDIIQGRLACQYCGVAYPVNKRMPYLIHDAQLEEYKAQEMQGWVTLWEKKGMYEEEHLIHAEASFNLPYVGTIWTDVARMFDMALDEMQLTGNEKVLDLGAGQGWAARHFAERGCEVVATDIVADEMYGLGRAWAIMDHAGVYFEPLLTDGEKLPFPDDSFDIVFFCGALHHFADFGKVLSQVNRVLKPGGRLIAAGEPSINIMTSEKAVQDSLEEIDEGIVERRPKVHEYWWELREAGFEKIQIDTFETYKASPVQVYSWIVAVRSALWAVLRPRYKPLAWLFFTFTLLLPPRLAAQLALFANGGNLFMRGRKPLR